MFPLHKSLLVFFLFLIGFHYSFSYLKKTIRTEIENNFSKAKIESFKIKIREEMENAIDKESFISKEDSLLINRFIEKIKSDLDKNNK